MDIEDYYRENDSNKSSSMLSEVIPKSVSRHTVNDDDNVIYHYDPKTNQYLQVLNNCDENTHYENNNCPKCNEGLGDVCHIDAQSLTKLKDSTKKLICLLEEIQSKTRTRTSLAHPDTNLSDLIKPLPILINPQTVTDVIGDKALKKLENQAKSFETTLIQDPEDDCSVYKRLTRKCICLNQSEYNDFIIHFNEDSRFFTTTIGEVIKNLRILKKFLYMGGDYTKHALMFLNEGLSESTHTEKVDICQGCSHSDICNIFEEHSIVVVLISWPCRYDHYGDSTSQGLAAAFLYKLTQLEEGRRYLKFNSKLTSDIKKILRTKVAKIEADTLKCLNATLNLMHPSITQSQHVNMSYYCKPVDEGFGSNTLGALVQYRQYMTLDEVLTHLDVLQNLSQKESGKEELISFLPAIISLFKHLLLENDHSEMNIIITNILNNIVSPNMVKSKTSQHKPKKAIANTATEPIIMKNDSVQIPPRKSSTRKVNKSKIGLSGEPNKVRNKLLRKVTNWEPLQKINKSSPRLLNKSRKFTKGVRNPLIIVPID